MKKLNLTLSFEEYASVADLPVQDRNLFEHAVRACDSAYAPYSHFRVGAAVWLENGSIVTGSNQENAAYPSGLCAERVALFNAGSQYPGVKIKAIAVTAISGKTNKQHPASPCGACRQVMAEYEQHHASPIRLIMMPKDSNILVAENIETILPLMFGSESLK